MTEPQSGQDFEIYDPYSSNPEDNPSRLTLEESKAVESVEVLLRRLPAVEPTALPLIKLYFFNFFHQNESYSQEQIDHLITRATHFSEQEKESGDSDNPLPTIGVEIEIPEEILTADKVRILEALGVSNYPESQRYTNIPLWEVNPSYTYSSWVSGQYLQELAKMGAIPLEAQTGLVPKDQLLSLHLNFGIPEELIHDLRQYSGILEKVNDVITYAYISKQRVLGRKTDLSHKLKSDASPSKKNKESSVKEDDDGPFLRVELRANEFRDFKTFRLLTEAQDLMGMYFSWVKKRTRQEISEKEKILAKLFDKFLDDAIGIIETKSMEMGIYGSEKNNLFDQDKELASRMLEMTDIQDKCRELLYHYAQEVRLVIE